MSADISSDQVEIIREFVQESRDMLDNLEPAIIELGQSCQYVDCWSTLSCTDESCSRHGVRVEKPCWLDKGFIGEGVQTCIFTHSEQDCKACAVFRSINGDPETMNAIFRLFHSMKGSAGFLDLSHISHVAHAAENLLDRIRSGKICLEPDHVELLCRSCDFSRAALDHVDDHFDDEEMAEDAQTITAQLEEAIDKALARAAGAPVEGPDSATPAPSPGSELDLLLSPEMIEKFILEADELLQSTEQGLLGWEENPEDQEIVAELFRNIHSFKGNCGFFGYADLERLSHQMETVLDAVKSGRDLRADNSAEILLGTVDILKDGISQLSRGETCTIEDLEHHIETLKALVSPRLGDLLMEKGGIDPQAIESAVQSQRRPLGEILVESGKATREQVEEALKEQQMRASREQAAAKGNKEKTAPVKRQDIRVDLEKLDDLINLIGEMVIAENMLIHNPDLQGLELESFTKASQQMSKIVRELQEMAMIIRMVPVSGLFRRMIRLVHDISGKSGKKVDLQLLGEETEVDKTVFENLSDPLVHLLRNSLDHGLEPPEERLKAGKPEKGTVKLSARHEEGEVWITVEDDGRGLNRDKILAKAIENGLIEGDGLDLSDRAVYNLIFQPGFSTADKITDISGRGVGMDVVKQNLQKIKGKVDVQSKPGQGSRMMLRIPLTLGIIEGMLVRVGKAKSIVPLLSIREIFRPSPEAITRTADGLELARVRESFFPVKRLHDYFRETPDNPEVTDGILIVLEYQENHICLMVDEILGQQQTVIKGLSSYVGNVQGTSGCTILGDGEIALILDVGSLFEMTEFS